MRRFFGVLAVSSLSLACGEGDPEAEAVDAFFTAVQEGDDMALERISLTPFEGQVETWEIVERGDESEAPFHLADLEAELEDKRREVEEERAAISNFISDNRETYEAYNAKYAEDPSAPFEGELATFHEQLQAMQTRVGELEAEAEQLTYDIEALRDAATLSVSTPVDTSFEGPIKAKPIQVRVNDGSADQTYTVFLQRYELVDTGQNRTPSARWIVADVQPSS